MVKDVCSARWGTAQANGRRYGRNREANYSCANGDYLVLMELTTGYVTDEGAVTE